MIATACDGVWGAKSSAKALERLRRWAEAAGALQWLGAAVALPLLPTGHELMLCAVPEQAAPTVAVATP